MTIAVVVPVANDGAERDRNWHFIQASGQYDGLHVVEAPDPEPDLPWSKGRAVNAAVAGVDVWRYPVLIIADSDCYLAREWLDEAIVALVFGAPWVVPHTTVTRLNEKSTRNLIGWNRGDPFTMVNGRKHKGPAGGGIVVLTHQAFITVGGIDPRFTGWGGEDISFGRALDTLVGPHVRLGAPLWHLWHRPLARTPERRASEANELLAGRYLDAVGDTEAMGRLVIE